MRKTVKRGLTSIALAIASTVGNKFKKNRDSTHGIEFQFDVVEKQFTMSVPDHVIFGVDDLNKPITFGEIRKITDDTELIKLLKNRLDVYLIEQINGINTPFPLSTMVCIGIETLGQIFIDDTSKKIKTDNSIKEIKHLESFRFIEVFKKFHQNFSRPVGDRFKEKLGELWLGEDVNDIDTLAKLVYKYFRNTMIHGYHGKGVYLSFEDTESFIKHDDGYLILNPNWLWMRYKTIYSDFFVDAINGHANNPNRICALKYINKIIK